jgi:hypothetical protein
MPQTITITSEAYSFDELSDAAKERARDWYRECIDEHDFSCEIDEFVTIGEAIGIDFDTHEVKLMSGKTRSDPDIYWSVGYCQSDHASFEGTYDYNAAAVAKLRAINDDDTWEPLRIATELAEIQLRNAFGIRAVCKVRGNRDYLSVEECYDRRDEERDLGADGKAVEECMERLARYLYKQLRDQSDYLHSDEAVDESILANDYKFDEEGNRHDYA